MKAMEKELDRIKTLYFGEATLVGKWLGCVLNRLDELGLRDETMVMPVFRIYLRASCGMGAARSGLS